MCGFGGREDKRREGMGKGDIIRLDYMEWNVKAYATRGYG